ncbi:MAG: hypothetical protein A2W25_02315 [candidate division Zixibacteria bacterium RBG_16_53_22]|nr:MAG: hypothetical protein A2W25_02315 [candidate division Zixibacteria bacterium RBG_16_53_22]
MKSPFVFGPALALALGSISTAQDPLMLKLSLQPGSAYIYIMDMNQTNVQTVDGEQQKLDQEMLLVWNYDVLERGKNQVMVVKLTYKRVKISQNYGHEIAEYDSDNPPDYIDPSMRGMASLPGTELIVRLTPTGEVLGIQGVDKMLDKMIAALELPDSPQRDQVVQNLRTQFGAGAVEQSLEQITSFYPGEPVSVGDRWKDTTEAISGFPMEIISEYELKSREGGRAMIDVTSELFSDPQDPMAMGPLTMAYDVSGSQTGVITVEEDTGLPIKSEISLEFAGDVDVAGVPNEKSQNWPISASGSVVVTFERQSR